jgi:hypothetical protein
MLKNATFPLDDVFFARVERMLDVLGIDVPEYMEEFTTSVMSRLERER